jgi:hypothetical protein
MKPPRNRQVKPPLLSPVSIQSENIQMDVHPFGNKKVKFPKKIARKFNFLTF